MFSFFWVFLMVVEKSIKDGNSIVKCAVFQCCTVLLELFKFSRYSVNVDTSSFEKSGRYSPCTHMHCRANVYVDVSG